MDLMIQSNNEPINKPCRACGQTIPYRATQCSNCGAVQ